MNSYINQYTLLFSLTWSVLYLVHPSWALPIPLTARGFLYFGLILYFLVLANIMNRWFKNIAINEPVIVYPEDFSKHVKQNIWLLLVCIIAALIHIKYMISPIYLVGDEALFIQGGLLIYDYFGVFWHEAAKYGLWIVVISALFIFGMKSTGNSNSEGLLSQKRKKTAISLFIFSGACFLILYFILIRDLPFAIELVRYPPLQKFLYFISYCIVGINYLGPRAVQFIFYILSAVYLYRTINLFNDRETSLLGASIYLFSPVIFTYAHFAELASGVIFFIIIISYYFLRYLIFQDNRGLLLSSYFIGTGFLYKRDIFLMFFICFAYLVFHKFKNKELHLTRSFKILLLPLFPIIPWLIIGKYYNWRGAWISLSKFTSFDTVTSYLLLIPAQISWIIFFLFVASFLLVLSTKKNHLSLFFGLVFVAFYAFYTSQALHVAIDRFAMAFYPSIAVFMAVSLSDITDKIRWKHSFKLVTLILTIYLIFLCAVSSFSERLITFKNVKEHYFPSETAMKWVRDNVKDGEKILSFRIKSDLYYRDKYGIDNDKIISFWYNLKDNYTPKAFRAYCLENNISYIIFPYSPNFADNLNNTALRTYIKENENNEFVEAARFNLDQNYIYIFKIKAI